MFSKRQKQILAEITQGGLGLPESAMDAVQVEQSSVTSIPSWRRQTLQSRSGAIGSAVALVGERRGLGMQQVKVDRRHAALLFTRSRTSSRAAGNSTTRSAAAPGCAAPAWYGKRAFSCQTQLSDVASRGHDHRGAVARFFAPGCWRTGWSSRSISSTRAASSANLSVVMPRFNAFCTATNWQRSAKSNIGAGRQG
jgi:hypothetical protein